MQKARKIAYLHPERIEDKEAVDQEQKPGRDTTKIYFFIIAIVALLATNLYFYVKYRSTEELATNINTEQVYMHGEIDRIEAEMNRLTLENEALSATLQPTQDSVRTMIAHLRLALSDQNLTQQQIQGAQVELDRLRAEVYRYRGELDDVKLANAQLEAEKRNLELQVAEHTQRVTDLEEENIVLNDQLRTAAELKLSNMHIVGIRERSRNRENVENKARRVDRFQITFTIADNPLVEPGEFDIYMRVIDPSGNLKTAQNLSFELSGNPMQYTEKTSMVFTNQGENYSVEWVDDEGFKRGTYTIVLYTENSTMGRSSIVLN